MHLCLCHYVMDTLFNMTARHKYAVTLDATNIIAEGLLKQIAGKGTLVHERKPKDFLAELFDRNFVDTFDKKLNNLEYKVPKLVGNTAGQLKKEFKVVLDDGCGGTKIKLLSCIM